MTKTKLVVAAFAALTLTAGQAFAQEEGEWEGEGEVGGEVEGGGVEAQGSMEVQAPDIEEPEGAATGLTTPAGKIRVNAVLGISLMEEAIAKPLALAPDVFYGVNDKLEVGLAHSSYALTGFMGQLGGGLCLSGEDGGCGKVYDGPTGILAGFGLMDGATQLAFDGGIILRQFSDPMLMGLKIGVRGRHMMGKLAIDFAPNIYVGITERDFNKEQINIPVALGFAASDKLMVGVQTGITGPLDGFGDAFSVPLSLAAAFNLNDNMTLGGALTLFRVAGFEGPGAADIRGLSLFFQWHN